MRKFIQLSCAASVAALSAVALSEPASAGIFDKINPVKAVKSVARDIGKTAKAAVKTVDKAASGVARGVAKTAKAAVKTVDKGVSSVARDVGKTANAGVRAVGKATTGTIRTVGRVAPKVVNSAGRVVAGYYTAAGKIAERIPVARELAPLARDVARAARSKEGQVGAVIGLGAAVATGGVSIAATRAAGGLGYATYKGKQVYKDTKARVGSEIDKAKREFNDIKRSVR